MAEHKEHRKCHSCLLLQKHWLHLQPMDQNNTLSLSAAISTDMSEFPSFEAMQSKVQGKAKGEMRCRCRRGKISFFSVLASACFEIYADYVSRALW